MLKMAKYQSGKDEKVTELNIGKLGLLFGSGGHSFNNIIGVICIILTLGLLSIIFFIDDNKIEILKIYSPILTLVFGYFIGSKKQ
mgnify:CR=1 FL=1